MDQRPLTVNLLGPFEIFRNGRAIRVERAKQKALVAYLCANPGRWTSRVTLADLLWERSSEDRARHSLNQAIYSLRRIIPELLLIRRDTISVAAAVVRTDLEAVQDRIKNGEIGDALALFRGPFIDDVDLKNAPEFEIWKSDFNRHFYDNQQRALALRVNGLPIEQQQRVTLDPRFARLFPLIVQLLPTPQRVMQASKVENDVPQAVSKAPFNLPFVGRCNEITTLDDLYQRCVSGTPTFAVVVGQPGHGKTRLLEEFICSHTDARIFRVKCYQAERRVGFRPVVDLLTHSVMPNDLTGLKDIWRTVLGELAPEKFSNALPPPRLSGLAGQSRLFEAVLQSLKEIARRQPLILFVDDVQWMDRSTRALFSFITRRLDAANLMVVAALRRKSQTSLIQSPWSEWTRIEVAELTRAEAGAIVDRAFAKMDAVVPNVDAILQLTGGHPYLLNEVLGRIKVGGEVDIRFLKREIPPRVEEFVGSLLQSMPKQSQVLLAVLSVLGRPVPSNVLRQISRVKQLTVALDLLLEREIAAISKHGIGLRHDLIREAAYRSIPPFMRTALHRRAATVLARTEKNVGEAALHYYRGGLRTLAFDNALNAAQIADCRHAYDESISFLKLAIKAKPSRSTQIFPTLAERYYRVHRIRDAHNTLNRVLRVEEKISAEHLIFDLELRYSLGKIDGASLRREVAAIKQSTPPMPLLVRLLRLETRSAHHDGDQDACAKAIRALRTFGADCGGLEGLEAIANAARVHSLLVSSSEGEQWLLEAIERFKGIPENETGIRVMGLLGTILYEGGKLKEAEEIHDRAMRVAEAIGAISDWPLLGVHAHMLMVEQGKFDDAREFAGHIRRRLLPEEAADALAALAANEASMHYELEEFELAELWCREAIKHTITRKAIWIQLEITGLRGLITLAQGRLSEAIDCEQSARQGIAALGYRCGDVSYIEILSGRLNLTKRKPEIAILKLREAIADYRNREVMCRLRMELELARLLKATDRLEARVQAKKVFLEATRIGARPLAEQADALLLRL